MQKNNLVQIPSKGPLDPRNIRLMPGKLVVEINNNARMGNILTTTRMADANNTGRIIHAAWKGNAIDANLPPDTQIGDYVFFNSRPLKNRKVPFQEPFDFCDIFDDSDILGLIRNGIFYPVGTKILVFRHNKGFKNPGSRIEIPGAQPTTDQTNWVTYLRRGLPKFHYVKTPDELRKATGRKWVRQLQQFKHFTEGLYPGARCRLKGWGEHMHEVLLPDGKFGLIVDESDIAYFYHADEKKENILQN